MSVDLGLLLALAYQEFVKELRDSLAEQGFDDLGPSDGFVFRALGQRPMTVSGLAVQLRVTKQGAGQIVDDMDRRGYLQRRPDPADGRAKLVELAPRGVAALAAAHRFHQQYERRLAREHGRAEVAATRAILTRMADSNADPLDPHLRALYL